MEEGGFGNEFRRCDGRRRCATSSTDEDDEAGRRMGYSSSKPLAAAHCGTAAPLSTFSASLLSVSLLLF